MRLDLTCYGCGLPGSDLRVIDSHRLMIRVQQGRGVMASESQGSGRPTPQIDEVPGGPEATAPSPGGPTRRTRISAAWVGVIIGVVALAFLLAFIIQNGQSVKVSFFTVNVKMPLGVALLLAAVAGVLLAGIVASLRIWQLRHRLRQSK